MTADTDVVEELDDRGRVRLVHESPGSLHCFVSGRPIDTEHVIEVRPAHHVLSPFKITVGAVDELCAALEAGFDEYREIGSRGLLACVPPGHVAESLGTCIICLEDVEPSDGMVGVVNTGGEPVGYVHGGECADEFQAAVERVWHHADDILADRV